MANTFGNTAFVVDDAAITIDGSAAPGLTIDGGGSLRLFAVANAAGLTLEDPTVTGGLSQGGAGGPADAGGAGGGGAGMGGAVFNDAGQFTKEAQRLVAECGLEWEPACLQFHQTARPVRIASVNQVRQPLYRKSLARGRTTKPSLEEISSPACQVDGRKRPQDRCKYQSNDLKPGDQSQRRAAAGSVIAGRTMKFRSEIDGARLQPAARLRPGR